MPIRVVYGDVGALGQLAVQAGQGEDFWRRYAAEQQLVQSQRIYNLDAAAIANQAFALQQASRGAYAPQPGNQAQIVGAGRYAPPAVASPAQIQAQQFSSQIQNMLKRGTINPAQADEVIANQLAGSSSPFSTLQRSQAREEDPLRYELAEVKAKRAAAEAKLEQLEMQIEGSGGLATPQQQQLMNQLFGEIVQSHEAEAQSNHRRATGALPGRSAAGGSREAPEGTVIAGPGGQILVKRNGQWVPQ